MTIGTTASIIAASICLAATVPAAWTAECTGGRCSCFGEDDCAALFQSGQCAADSEVKSTMEIAPLCALEAKPVVLGSCRQAPRLRNVVISADDGRQVVFPHLSKGCGG